MKALSAPAAIAAIVLLAGCGLHNPDLAHRPSHAGVPVPVAPAGLRTPAAALSAQHDSLVRVAVDFTLTQATWSPDTYVSQQARLAELSSAQALAALTPPGGQPPAAIAAQLRAAGSSSQASVIGTDGPNPARQVVVAYKTLATGIGRNTSPGYQIAHVTLTAHAGGWLVSSFEIQP